MPISFDKLNTCGPTSRRFTPAVFAVKRFTSISGAGISRLYGKRPSDATLQMSFMLDDDDLVAVFDCWYLARGTFDTLDLPDQFLAGASEVLDAGVPGYLEWRWAEAPSVENILPGRSKVQINLVAQLDI